MLGWVVTAFAGAPSIDEPVRSGAASPNDAALVVAIEDYAFLPDVPHARRDLAAVADVLTYTRGLAPERVVRLDGGSVEQIRAGLDRARGALGSGGTLWVWFAGHGAADPATGALLLVGDDAKADPTVFAARSLALDALLAELPAGAVVLLDTCWAGAARSGEALIPGSRFAVPAYAGKSSGKTVWTAASPAELANAYEPARHGAFTYFVVGALRGWADGERTGERDGRVDLDEASAFVTRALAATGVRAQAPTIDGPAVTGITTGRLEAAPDLASFPQAQATEAVVYGVLGEIGGAVPPFAIGSPWTPPFREVRKGVYADTRDQTVSFAALAAMLPGDLEGDEAARRYRRALAPQAVGGGLLTLGALDLATAAWVPFLQYSKAKNGLGCDDTDAIDYICIDEQKNLVAGTTLTSVGVALVGSGLGLVISGKKRAAEAREEVVELVSERLTR